MRWHPLAQCELVGVDRRGGGVVQHAERVGVVEARVARHVDVDLAAVLVRAARLLRLNAVHLVAAAVHLQLEDDVHENVRRVVRVARGARLRGVLADVARRRKKPAC